MPFLGKKVLNASELEFIKPIFATNSELSTSISYINGWPPQAGREDDPKQFGQTLQKFACTTVSEDVQHVY